MTKNTALRLFFIHDIKIIEDPEKRLEVTPSHGQCQEMETPVFICSLNPYFLLHKIGQAIILCIFLINDSANRGQLHVNE